jgi:hypothetical protein
LLVAHEAFPFRFHARTTMQHSANPETIFHCEHIFCAGMIDHFPHSDQCQAEAIEDAAKSQTWSSPIFFWLLMLVELLTLR